MSSGLVRLWRVLLIIIVVLLAGLYLTSAQAQFRPPQLPIPPGPRFPGRGAPGFEWTCSKCGAVIGRGMMKPTVANCPKCGARFNNTMGGMMANMHDRMGNPSGGMPPPGFNPPSTAPSPPFMTSPAPPMMPPAPVPPPVPVPEMSTPPLPAPDTPTSDSTNNTPTATSQGFGARTLLAVGILGGGLLVLIGALAAILYFCAASGTREAPKRRRKRVYHDDD